MTSQLAIRDEMPVVEIAQAFVKSGFFQDTRDVSQAIVKIMAGREFGFGAFASMNGIHIIQGKPSLGADLMASAVKRSGRYDYRVRQMDATCCSIEYFQGSHSIGISTFTAEDARKAGTKNMDKYPRNMLFARAMSNGVRWYCPDVFGSAVYTPEEMGADVDEEGRIIPGSYTLPDAMVNEQPSAPNGSRPYAPETVKAKILAYAQGMEQRGVKANGSVKMVVPNLEALFAGEDAERIEARKILTGYLFGVTSSKDLTDYQKLALVKWMNYSQVDGEWIPDLNAVQEARAIVEAANFTE